MSREFEDVYRYAARIHTQEVNRLFREKMGRYHASFLGAINKFRESRDAAPVTIEFALTRIASPQASWCEKKQSLVRTGPSGENLEQRAKKVDYWGRVAEVFGRARVGHEAFHYMVSDPLQSVAMSDSDFNSIGLGKSGEFWVCVLGFLPK